MLKKIFTTVFIFFSTNSLFRSSSQELFSTIVREDYCELFCRGPCDNIYLNDTCNILGNSITTLEYKIEIERMVLKFDWITQAYGIFKIFPRKTILNLINYM